MGLQMIHSVLVLLMLTSLLGSSCAKKAVTLQSPAVAVASAVQFIPSPSPSPSPSAYVSLPVYATLLLPSATCLRIAEQQKQNWYDFSATTADAWNKIFPGLPVPAGYVSNFVFAANCVVQPKSRKGPFPGSPSITINALVGLPDGVTVDQAELASSLFIETVTKVYISSNFTSDYNITYAAVTTHASFGQIPVYCTGTTSKAAVYCTGGSLYGIYPTWLQLWLQPAKQP